jgi:hypothetical protein
MEKDLRKATVDFDFLEDVEEIITPGHQWGVSGSLLYTFFSS